MKILITTDFLSSIRDNEESRSKWNVDRILYLGKDINDSLLNLPFNQEDIAFLIPTVINANNALEYDGADLALRILFKYLCNRSIGIGIVLLGFESREAFLSHYSYPNILKIPGITYSLFNRKIVSCISTKQPALQKSQYKSYIEHLGLSLPASFKSTHSLTNEWCIYKWASYLELDNVNEHNGLELLYFDYIKAIEKINSVKQKSLANNQKLLDDIQRLKMMSSKILLVDDNVGWHHFFKEFFKGSKIQFEAIGDDFRKMEFEEITRIITDSVNSFAPDVILLDFRLLEDKDADSGFREISGTKILKALKGRFDAPGNSFGRQILIFTATSRIENIIRLKELNADGFILKEKPEYYASKEITKDSVSRMVRVITEAIERADYLIPLNQRLSSLVSLISNSKDITDSKLKDIVVVTAEAVRLITQNNNLNLSVLKLVYLDLFKIFEGIKEFSGLVCFPNEYSMTIRANRKLSICSYEKSSLYQKSHDDWNCINQSNLSSIHHKYCKEKNLNFAMCAVILFRLGYTQVDDTEWNNIRTIRNTLAHGDNGQLAKRNLTLNCDTLRNFSIKTLDLISDMLNPAKIKQVTPE